MSLSVEKFGEIMQTLVLLEAVNYDIGFNDALLEGRNLPAKQERHKETRDSLRKEIQLLLRQV